MSNPSAWNRKRGERLVLIVLFLFVQWFPIGWKVEFDEFVESFTWILEEIAADGLMLFLSYIQVD